MVKILEISNKELNIIHNNTKYPQGLDYDKTFWSIYNENEANMIYRSDGLFLPMDENSLELIKEFNIQCPKHLKSFQDKFPELFI